MKIEQNIPLANLTTIQVGGVAKFYSRCCSQKDLTDSIDWARANKQPFLVLGGGSNTLIKDAGFDGLVIHIDIQGVAWSDTGLVKASAGENWSNFVLESTKRGLCGIECLAGIPGTVGATPIQNVGAYGQEVKDVIEKVVALRIDDKEVVEFSNLECEFQYRNSRFKDQAKDRGKFIVLEVWFSLKKSEYSRIESSKIYPELERSLQEDSNWELVQSEPKRIPSFVSNKVIGLRSLKGMVLSKEDPDSVSLGSFFMNPIVSNQKLEDLKLRVKNLGISEAFPFFPSGQNQWKLSAAWLIERSGLKKGFSIGNAGVSTKHCLAIINKGGASCDEILHLANHIQKSVKEKFDIELKMEPEVV